MEGASPQKSVVVDHAVSKVGKSVHAVLVPKSVSVSRLGVRERCGTYKLLLLEKSPKDPYTSSTPLRLHKEKQISLLYILGIFQTAALMLYLSGAVYCAMSSRVGTKFPLTLYSPKVEPLIFKVLVVKPH